jgi:hypothetical protein
MLREVINKHIKPRIIPFQVTTLSSAATVNIGYGDLTATSASAGASILTTRAGFSRNSLIFGTTAAAVGSTTTIAAASISKNTFTLNSGSQADSGLDATMDGILFGWDSTDLSLCLKQKVVSTQTSPRTIWGKVTGSSGAVAINANDFSCTRVSDGVYTVTFDKAFGKIPVVLIQPISATASARVSSYSSKTATGVTVNISDAAATPADSDFYILAIGSDSRSDSGRGRMPLQNSQRKPRIVGAQILYTGGVPSIVVGGATGGADIGTLVDIGTGNGSFIIGDLFKREPAIFLTSSRRAQVVSNSAGAVEYFTFNSSGTATDTTTTTPLNVFIIGTDVNETF